MSGRKKGVKILWKRHTLSVSRLTSERITILIGLYANMCLLHSKTVLVLPGCNIRTIMSDLLNLPNEILYRIIECFDLRDLDPFSTTCSSLEHLTRNALKLHHAQEKSYIVVVVLQRCVHSTDLEYIYKTGFDPFYATQAICKNPSVAGYPDSLRTWDCERRKKEHKDGEWVSDEEVEGSWYLGKVVDEGKAGALSVFEVMEDCGE